MRIAVETIKEHLKLTPLKKRGDYSMFESDIDEYTEFLHKNAAAHERHHVSSTHFLVDKRDNSIIAYMSLVNDNVALTVDEKVLAGLPEIPFSTLPAMKIGKLSVDKAAKEKYSGIGSFMINLATVIAYSIDEEQGSACRFITIDADVENNPTVVDFYIKNGFVPNEKVNNKNRITISMRKDIFTG